MGFKLFVGNLAYTTGELELREAFAPFGTITEIEIASDRYTGRPRGFGFVTFNTDAEGKAAIEKLNGTAIGGNMVNVNEAKARDVTTVGGRTFTSPNRRPGAFYTRGKRRH